MFSLSLSLSLSLSHTHTHTHTHMYIDTFTRVQSFYVMITLMNGVVITSHRLRHKHVLHTLYCFTNKSKQI